MSLLVVASLLLQLEHLELLLSLVGGVGDRRVDQRSDSGRELGGLDAERVGKLEDLGLNVTTTILGRAGACAFVLPGQPSSPANQSVKKCTLSPELAEAAAALAMEAVSATEDLGGIVLPLNRFQ